MNNGLLNIKIPKIKNKTSSRIKITWHLIEYSILYSSLTLWRQQN
jgi:hypothetical protein